MTNHHKLTRHLTSLWIVGLLLLTTACSSTPDEVFLQKAEKISNQLLDAMTAQRYADAVKIYDKRFFERITPQAWQIDLKKLSDKLGTYQSKKITASSVTHGFSTISAVTTVLVFRITYEKTFAVQKFTFMSSEKADNMSLIGHYIDFPEQE